MGCVNLKILCTVFMYLYAFHEVLMLFLGSARTGLKVHYFPHIAKWSIFATISEISVRKDSLKCTVNGTGNKGTSIHQFMRNGVGNLCVIVYHCST